MYITPRTNIRLLRGCPIDPNNVDTIYFASAAGQASYFMGLTKYNLNNYTYQRYAKNVLRVQILADHLYDVNYMMFKNDAYGDKWFYAFVDNVEYINDATTEIRYHLDDIQSWMFDWRFEQCFIERQHSETDNFGDNIITEPVECGEYVFNNYDRIKAFSNYNTEAAVSDYTDPIIIAGVTEVDGLLQVTDGKSYDGIYSGLTLYAFANNQAGLLQLNNLINEQKQHPDSLVALYMAPKDVLSETYINGLNLVTTDLIKVPTGTEGNHATEALNTYGDTIDGYTPKNKKLFTYPYNFEEVFNGECDSLTLRYEFFNTTTPYTATVELSSTIMQPVQVVCTPKYYKGLTDPDETHPLLLHNVNEKIILSGYPQCSWNMDAWLVWLSQNCVPIALQAASAGASAALAMYNPAVATTVGTGVFSASGQEITKEVTSGGNFSGNTNAALYGLHQTTNLLTNVYKASIAADIIKGNISSANAAFSAKEYCFTHGRMSVNRQQARIIDDFFTRYGYAMNKVDYPNIHTRAGWTYVKTVGCTIGGGIPADSKSNIENIFDSGIRFWSNANQMGDYSAPNGTLIH